MKRLHTHTSILILGFALCATCLHAAETSLVVSCEAGDPVCGGDPAGMGRTFSLSTPSSSFTSLKWPNQNGATIHIFPPIGSDPSSWLLEFKAPNEDPLVPGDYAGATRSFGFSQSFPNPTMWVASQTGCNAVVGSFAVLHSAFDSLDNLLSLWVTFEQRCVNFPGVLRGDLRFNLELVDLAVTKSGPAEIVNDSDFAYQIGITNNSLAAATNVTLTDDLPDGTTFVSASPVSGPGLSCATPPPAATGSIVCSIDTLPAGGTAEFTFVLHADPGLPPGRLVTNIAAVSSLTPDPLPGNNTATSVGRATGPVPIPISPWGLALLGLALGLSGFVLLRH